MGDWYKKFLSFRYPSDIVLESNVAVRNTLNFPLEIVVFTSYHKTTKYKSFK